MNSYEERISDLQKRRAQLLAQEKKLKAQQKEADRKARTRRLIAIGAGVESVLQRQVHEGDELNNFLEILRIYDIGKEF